ncbi:hypothetical protein FMK73_25355 [Klebsiella michiganensis]|nr:hypothetical protein [Klebsiella michiganensis]MBZ7357739.1 hypothetical protein [Klebsiella michiganensis]
MGMVLILYFVNGFLNQASFGTGYWCYDRHRLAQLVICNVWRLIRAHNLGWVPLKGTTIWHSYLGNYENRLILLR